MKKGVAALTRQAIVATAAVSLAALLGCHPEATPPPGPEAACASACQSRAKQCDERQCGRGCNFIIDRLTENEGDHVLACVASAGSACDDHTWARCATRVGPHADGGPPAPPPPKDFEEEE